MSACATSVPLGKSAPAPSLKGTVLLHVTVSDPGAPTNLPLQVGIELMDLATGEPLQHVAEALPAGRSKARSVRLHLQLPAGGYSLARIVARLGAQSDGLMLSALAEAPFEVKAGQVGDLGRLHLAVHTLKAQGPRHQLSVQWLRDPGYAAEAAAWQHGWPALKQARVQPIAFKGFDLVHAQVHGSETVAALPLEPPASLRAFGVANAAAAVQWPEALRGHYTRFLKLPHPRALAIGTQGHAAVSSGTNGAVDKALAQCQAQAAAARCTLVAVDGTLLVDPATLDMPRPTAQVKR